MAAALTVTGPVVGSDLEPTLAHEHVLISLAYAFPAVGAEAEEPITMGKLGDLRIDMMKNTNTVTLKESTDPEDELSRADEAGVQTIVDLTSPELSWRDTMVLLSDLPTAFQ